MEEWEKEWKFKNEFTITYTDLDLIKHANNTTSLKYFYNSRLFYLKSKLKLNFEIKREQVKYIKQMRVEDKIIVGSKFSIIEEEEEEIYIEHSIFNITNKHVSSVGNCIIKIIKIENNEIYNDFKKNLKKIKLNTKALFEQYQNFDDKVWKITKDIELFWNNLDFNNRLTPHYFATLYEIIRIVYNKQLNASASFILGEQTINIFNPNINRTNDIVALKIRIRYYSKYYILQEFNFYNKTKDCLIASG
jgi:acyl-CoA thioesterase FadM